MKKTVAKTTTSETSVTESPLQSSQDLRAVQEMLGHASIASTQIYTSLDFQHLAQAYDKAHPRAKTGKA